MHHFNLSFCHWHHGVFSHSKALPRRRQCCEVLDATIRRVSGEDFNLLHTRVRLQCASVSRCGMFSTAPDRPAFARRRAPQLLACARAHSGLVDLFVAHLSTLLLSFHHPHLLQPTMSTQSVDVRKSFSQLATAAVPEIADRSSRLKTVIIGAGPTSVAPSATHAPRS